MYGFKSAPLRTFRDAWGPRWTVPPPKCIAYEPVITVIIPSWVHNRNASPCHQKTYKIFRAVLLFNSPQVQRTKMSIDNRMDKYMTGRAHNGILTQLNKQQLPRTTGRNLVNVMLRERTQTHKRTHPLWFHLSRVKSKPNQSTGWDANGAGTFGEGRKWWQAASLWDTRDAVFLDGEVFPWVYSLWDKASGCKLITHILFPICYISVKLFCFKEVGPSRENGMIEPTATIPLMTSITASSERKRSR